MAIKELIEQGLSEEQAIRFAVTRLGMAEDDARFMLKVEQGETDGDVVDDEGRSSYESLPA